MKLKIFNLVFLSLSLNLAGFSQSNEDALKYFEKLAQNINVLIEPSMEYTKAFFIEQDSLKVVKLQSEYVEIVKKSYAKTDDLGPFKSDASLYNAAKNYLEAILKSHNMVLALRKIEANRSYDKMLKFVDDFEKINLEIATLNQKLIDTQDSFAKKHGFQVKKPEGEAEDKVAQSQQLTKYYNQCFLIKFRCQITESKFLEEFNNSNLSGMKENYSTLEKAIAEGQNKTKSLGAFLSDNSLKNDLIRTLGFYKEELVSFNLFMAYFIEKENFEKVDKQFNSIKNPTNADISSYNAIVDKLNKTNEKVNLEVNKTNVDRDSDAEKWNATVTNFFKKHF